MKAKVTLLLGSLVASLVAIPPATRAEVLKLGGQVEVVKPADAPRRGMTKAMVEKRFGKPAKKNPAIGKPPISSWEYPGYTVYFEGNHVIHTVANGHRGKH